MGLPVGTTYLQATPGLATLSSIAQSIPAAVSAGQSYQGSIWVRAASGTGVSGTLALWGLGATYANGATYFTVGPTWTQINVAFNASSNFTALRLQVYFSGPNGYDFLDAQLTPQLLSNSDFTQGFSSWAASAGSNPAVYPTAGLPIGSTFLQIDAGSAAVPSIAQTIPATVNAGRSYQGSIWIKAATGASVSGALALWGLGATNANGATYFNVGPTWTQINVAFDATTSASALRLQVYLGNHTNMYDFLDAQITPQALSNADFTQGFSHWSASSGTSVAALSGFEPMGTSYVQVTPGPSTSSILQALPATVGAGQTYQGSIWVRAASGTSVSGVLALWGLGATYANGATYFTVGTGWTQVTVPFNPTRNFTALQLQVYLTSPGQYDFLGAGVSEPPPGVTGTGPYGFEDFKDALTALGEGWPGIGSVSGFCTAPSSAYACATGADTNMEAALNDNDSKDFWLSFWTIGAPVNHASWYLDGFTAGRNAARELVNSGRQPTFEILDPEGFGGAPTTTAGWIEFSSGWSAGLLSISSAMHPGLYADQFLISTYGLLSLSIPIFVAVSPILGNSPHVFGSRVHGYIAFYAACPAGSYVNQMTGWGGALNTLQFRDSAVDCAP